MSKNYPIVLGHKFRKGILDFRDPEGEFRFMLCRLKKEHRTGDEFELEDIESVEKRDLVYRQKSIGTDRWGNE